MVDAVETDLVQGGAAGAHLQRGPVALDQPVGEGGLGGTDRAAGRSVELDGEVGDPARRDVGDHVDLAAAHDAHVDHAGPCGGREARVGRGEPGLLEGGLERPERHGVVDPAEELPDRPEVLDVVDERGAGEGHEQRPGDPGADPVGQGADVLGPLGGLVLDEVGLVDDHATEAEVAEPADVPVEELVVDDHHVGEAVHLVAVAVHHGGPPRRRPQRHLVGPVRLDDVGDHDQQRVGVGGLCGEQGLRGLAEPGLVGEQERAVTTSRGRDDLRLVRHDVAAPRDGHRTGVGQGHASRCTGGGHLEGPEERLEQLPAGQPAGTRRGALGRSLEVRGQEGVRHLARDHRAGHHLGRGAERRRGRDHGRGRLLRLGWLHPGGQQHLATERAGGLGDPGVVR